MFELLRCGQIYASQQLRNAAHFLRTDFHCGLGIRFASQERAKNNVRIACNATAGHKSGPIHLPRTARYKKYAVTNEL